MITCQWVREIHEFLCSVDWMKYPIEIKGSSVLNTDTTKWNSAISWFKKKKNSSVCLCACLLSMLFFHQQRFMNKSVLVVLNLMEWNLEKGQIVLSLENHFSNGAFSFKGLAPLPLLNAVALTYCCLMGTSKSNQSLLMCLVKPLSQSPILFH